MKQSRIERRSQVITNSTRNLAGTLAMATVFLGMPARAASPVFISAPNEHSVVADVADAEIVRLSAVGGYFAFVQQSAGDIGIVAVGGRTFDVLRALTAQDAFSALEIYQVLGGNPRTAPSALLNDHQKLATRKPARPQLPSLSSLMIASGPSVQGQSDLGIVGGSACVEGATPTYDYFEQWWGGLLFIPGVGAIEDIGAHGQEGHGVWSQGAGDLNLGSTGAGAAVVCFPQESNHDDARITVQEYAGNGVWFDLWSEHSVYNGVAYGYWFKGYVVHRVRLLVRDERPPYAQNPVIGPFYWGGAY